MTEGGGSFVFTAGPGGDGDQLQSLGCSRCRYARAGCRRCRNPEFRPRNPAASLPELATLSLQQRKEARGKRRRRAAPEEPGSTAAAAEPLLHQLRRHLGQDGPKAEVPAAGRLKRAASGSASPSGKGAPPRRKQARNAEPGQPQQQALAAAAKRDAEGEPSPTSRRPAKRTRREAQPPAEPAATAAEEETPPAPAPAPDHAAAAASRPAGAAKRQHGSGDAPPTVGEVLAQRPAKYRRIQTSPAQQAQQEADAAGGMDTGSSGRGGEEEEEEEQMDVDGGEGGPPPHPGSAPPSAAPGFMAQLEENMLRRRDERASGAPSPLGQRLSQQGGRAPQRGASPWDAAGPDPRLALWEPPASPYGLIEEELYQDPWRLLVACMLLNKTTGTQVRRVIWDLFRLCPTPAAAVAADVKAIEALIQPLGLFRKRAVALQRLSEDYLYKQWRRPSELFGIGQYGDDAYRMFCRGEWRECRPEDKDLRKYRDWLGRTGGQGTGLTRHRSEGAAAGGS